MTWAVIYRRPGDPAEVLEVTEIEDPAAPGHGQIQVEVTAFPIHPGDLLHMVTESSSVPRIATRAGLEATGVVAAVGPGVDRFGPGDRVTLFPHPGAWSGRINVAADVAVPVPTGLSEDVAAQLLVNPITAVLLRRAAEQHFAAGFDGVVLNNAATSAVGRLFTAVAEYHRLPTISIVRSTEGASRLRLRFPNVPIVATSDSEWADQVRAGAADRPIAVALDPVGGPMTDDLLRLLTAGGRLVLYGKLGGDDIAVSASTILDSDLTVTAMTIGRWLGSVSTERRASDVAEALSLAVNVPQHFEVAGRFGLDDLPGAVRLLSTPGKTGVVLAGPTVPARAAHNPILE